MDKQPPPDPDSDDEEAKDDYISKFWGTEDFSEDQLYIFTYFDKLRTMTLREEKAGSLPPRDEETHIKIKRTNI